MARSYKTYTKFDEDRDDSRPDSYRRGRERKVRKTLREAVGVIDPNELYSALEEPEEGARY